MKEDKEKKKAIKEENSSIAGNGNSDYDLELRKIRNSHS